MLTPAPKMTGLKSELKIAVTKNFKLTNLLENTKISNYFKFSIPKELHWHRLRWIKPLGCQSKAFVLNTNQSYNTSSGPLNPPKTASIYCQVVLKIYELI